MINYKIKGEYLFEIEHNSKSTIELCLGDTKDFDLEYNEDGTIKHAEPKQIEPVEPEPVEPKITLEDKVNYIFLREKGVI